MKLLAITTSLLVAASALAQGIIIGTPTPGEDLKIGKRFTVQVEKPDTIDTSIPVAVAIGLQPCATGFSCSEFVDDRVLDQVLFTGAYKPVFHEPGKPQYQNFSVIAPSGVPPQSAVLHVIHFFLVGAGPSPTLGATNVTVNLVNATQNH